MGKFDLVNYHAEGEKFWYLNLEIGICLEFRN